MQWSKLKSSVEARFAPSLSGRVTIHQARYRYTQEEVGRVWIAVDGRDIASFATGAAWRRVSAETERLMDERDHWGSSERYGEAMSEAEATVRRAGVYDDGGALMELEQSLSLSIKESLTSDSPLLRALAILDARVGKRRLLALASAPDPHPLVRLLLTLRCEAESIQIPPDPVR
jgi:hypothetical protein